MRDEDDLPPQNTKHSSIPELVSVNELNTAMQVQALFPSELRDPLLNEESERSGHKHTKVLAKSRQP